MVCIYCGSKTQVINSRLQKHTNKVWRRRQCTDCQAIFSSLEHSVYENSLSIQNKQSMVPFQRDVLFLSIYQACRHRQNSVADASALTDTVLGKLVRQADQGLIRHDSVVKTTLSALKQFDKAAFVYYGAFHRL